MARPLRALVAAGPNGEVSPEPGVTPQTSTLRDCPQDAVPLPVSSVIRVAPAMAGACSCRSIAAGLAGLSLPLIICWSTVACSPSVTRLAAAVAASG
ncbi:MAG: hypothetical protein ACKOWF_12430 [Chloroflexota bacterium]